MVNVWNVMESMETVFCFHNIPYIKKVKTLIYRGMEVWNFLHAFSLFFLKTKKKCTQ